MLQTYRKLYDLLEQRERRLALFVLGFMFFVALLDTVGVASILPFIAVLANPEVIHSNKYLSLAYENLGFTSNDSFLFWLGIAVLVMLITTLFFRAMSQWVKIRFTSGRNHSLSKRLIEKYLGQPYPWFLNRHSARLGNTILGEVGGVVSGALNPAISIIANGMIAILLLGLLVAVDGKLALIVMAVLGGAYAVTYMGVRQRVTRLGQEQREAQRERFQVAQEAFGAIKELKVAGLEATCLKRYEVPSARLASIAAVQSLVSQIPAYIMQAVIFGGMMIVLLYLLSTHDNLESALPILAVYAFAGYRLMPTLQGLYAEFTRLRGSAALLDSVHGDYHGLEADPLLATQPERMGLSDRLELCGVSFKYPNAPRSAMHELDICIPVRTTVGLVGSTGSGKTTTVDVILGLLSPDAGSLKVDGVELSASNIRSWQRCVGYVPQQIYLTDESISHNIAFGLPEDQIDMAAVERAARIANLHDFVIGELPEGYDTLVGERGVRLSGGQRQRIGIARALYHDPDVIVMDEATSALDNLTEQAVMEAVQNLAEQKTVILIAHRLSTVQDCDQIFFLEHGSVVAAGTFDELVSGNSKFRAMAGAV